MRCAAAIPACAVLVGAAAGVCLTCPALVWWVALIGGWAALGLTLWRDHGSRARLAVATSVTGFIGAGGVLGEWDAARARHPSLLEELARHDLDPTTCGGQPPAGLRHSCDIIADLEGTLRSDAAAGEFGMTFTLDVDRAYVASNAGEVRRDDRVDSSAARAVRSVDSGARAVAGAVRVTVGGQSAAARMAEWRAGRRICAPVSLRAPLPYRNVGVPDQRDRLALAGLGLFGSIKSATLVQVVAPGHWWQERAADLRAWARRAITNHVRPRANESPRNRAGPSPGPGGPPSASLGQSAAIVIAVLIGDRAGLSPDVERRLQRAGTYHVIAISGGNIAILTGLLLAALRLLPIPPSARVCLVATLVLLYALVIDAGPSVVRATMAAVAYLGARAIDVEARSLDILAAIVFLMLLAAPLDIVDAGFWLTCGATLGILLHAGPALQRLHAMMPRLRPVVAWTLVSLVSLVVTTFFAELVLLPITALTFSQITLAGLLLNIAAIPLMTVVQVAGMATLAADANAPLASAAGVIAHLAATGLVRSANLVDLAPWMAIRVAPPPLWLACAYFVSWAGLWIRRIGRDLARDPRVDGPSAWASPVSRIGPSRPVPVSARVSGWSLRSALQLELLQRPAQVGLREARTPLATIRGLAASLLLASATRARLRLAMAVLWTTCLALIVCAPPLPALPLPFAATAESVACQPLPVPSTWRNRPWMALTMIDVGQGGAALVQADDGSALLVDAGGTTSGAFDIGARVVSPALWALGIRRLDALALTHGDVDHVGGAPAVVDDFQPRELWSAELPADAPTGDDRLTAIAAKARARGAALRTLAAGDRLSLGHASIRVWNPPSAAGVARVAPDEPVAPRPLIVTAGAPSRGRLRNDDSLVLDVRLGDVSIVLPGDIGADVERRLARDPGDLGAPPARLRVLAAAHHGSQTSSSAIFLDAFAPRVVLISAGLNNRHGHPSPATLDRYRARAIPVFRTDLDGAIQVLTNGAATLISTCSGRRITVDRTAARSP